MVPLPDAGADRGDSDAPSSPAGSAVVVDVDDDALPEVDDAAVVDDEPASVDETGAEPELDAAQPKLKSPKQKKRSKGIATRGETNQDLSVLANPRERARCDDDGHGATGWRGWASPRRSACKLESHSDTHI